MYCINPLSRYIGNFKSISIILFTFNSSTSVMLRLPSIPILPPSSPQSLPGWATAWPWRRCARPTWTGRWRRTTRSPRRASRCRASARGRRSRSRGRRGTSQTATSSVRKATEEQGGTTTALVITRCSTYSLHFGEQRAENIRRLCILYDFRLLAKAALHAKVYFNKFRSTSWNQREGLH